MYRRIAVGALVALGAAVAANAQHASPPKGGGHDSKAPAGHAAAGHGTAKTAACTLGQIGPQSPRDITKKDGSNAKATFEMRPSSAMNLCNIHFHNNAEHKAPAFNVSAGPAGFRCTTTIPADMKAADPQLRKGACGGTVRPGDTIEVHWVFTSCPVRPGSSLDACSTAACQHPHLTVESQVFLVVNGAAKAPGVQSFLEYGTAVQKGGFWQPKSLPQTDNSVRYRGSTTNPSYNEKSSCSPSNVAWNVRQSCATLDIRSLDAWCTAANSPFRPEEAGKLKDIEGHPPRGLVTHSNLLSKIN